MLSPRELVANSSARNAEILQDRGLDHTRRCGMRSIVLSNGGFQPTLFSFGGLCLLSQLLAGLLQLGMSHS